MIDAGLNEDLTTLNHIAQTLNRATDVKGALDSALAQLVGLMGLETGWISLVKASSLGVSGRQEFFLAAHRNLPPGLAPDRAAVWNRTCRCQDVFRQGDLAQAYAEVHCSRLESAPGDTRGLTVHASAPLVSGERWLGILNVAGQDWTSFTPRSLSLLTLVGNHIGIALERAELFDALKERRFNEQAALLDFSNQLLRRIDREDLTRQLVSQIAGLLEADACSLLLPEEGGGGLKFVAATGWKQDPVELERRVPLEGGSGPGWVMRTQKPLLVEDLQRSDPTSWSTAWLEAEGFRGHAVVPLIVEEHAIGTLIMNHRRPRRLTQDELRLLQLMANQAAIAIETARLRSEDIERLRMEREMDIGREMQRSLLPAEYPRLPGYEFAVLYQAARQVGGDFYDFCRVGGPDGKLGLIIGDVSGKGVPAALFMAMCRTNIRAAVLSGRSPSEALKRANELILKDSRSDVFLTAVCALLTPQTGRLTYANGGHNRPFLIHAASGEVRELTARGIILGQFEEVEIEEEQIELAPRDTLILYTDGVTEAIDAGQQPFGEDRLKAVLESNIGSSPEDMLSAIAEAVRSFAGEEPQADDFAVVAVART
jgi:sigma-B regulation protein RsbU (phosphoserine phosphatase)